MTTAYPIAVNRKVFATPRAAEFLELRALQAQTGQPAHAFGDVVVKELIDNALDAAETAGRAPVLEIATDLEGDVVRVTVSDNGSGITTETVARICDFTATVSDKARYRGPARGAQGNAMKTLLGIPYALGVDAPVVIVSMGVRHELKVMVDPVGDVVVAHDQTNVDSTGTSVSVPVPVDVAVDVSTWAYDTALVNPHATITVTDRGYCDGGAEPDIYKPAGGQWSKWTPSMPSSPHWYDPAAFCALVHSHIRETSRTGVDVPLGRFISEFDGLSGSAKQKQIRSAAPGITHLSALQGREDIICVLHTAMTEVAKPTSPARLGPVGKEHLERMLDVNCGVHRCWYKQATVTEAGVPWVIEVAVADTQVPGGVAFGCNHAPAFGDPLGRAELRGGDICTTGAKSFLSMAGVTDEQRAAVVHVICAATQFVDKGKVALVVPKAVADAAAGALEAATKVIRREEEQRRKDASKAARAEERAREEALKTERREQWTLKDAVFEVMEEAKAAAGATVSSRTLYYQVRPLIQDYTDAELTQNYFSQTLCPEYERTVEPLRGVYYEPRGELHEPHGGQVIPLGTREVEVYVPPSWSFDKIAYIEKTGLQAQLAPYRLGDRHDMAIIFGQGYPVTACRELLERFDIHDVKIFVIHDADIDGYNIARTLGEATRRMPNHSVDVIDLGLTVPQAIEIGLETERFTRRKALPSTVEFDDDALDWFTGEPFYAGNGKTHYRCIRCELNAFSSDGLVEFIEAGLQRHGATEKLLPPPDVLAGHVQTVRDETLTEIVATELARMVDIAGVVRQLLTDHPDLVDVDEARVRETFTSNPFLSWRSAAEQLVDQDIDGVDGLADAVRAHLLEQLADDEDDAS